MVDGRGLAPVQELADMERGVGVAATLYLRMGARIALAIRAAYATCKLVEVRLTGRSK